MDHHVPGGVLLACTAAALVARCMHQVFATLVTLLYCTANATDLPLASTLNAANVDFSVAAGTVTTLTRQGLAGDFLALTPKV